MQALCSRTTQLQTSCCCKLYLQTGRTLARRSTTATFRRKVSGADIFTAFYTTILGTAAILDASQKDLRRQEIDQKLEKARAELDSLKEDTSRQDHGQGSLDGQRHERHNVRSGQYDRAGGSAETITANLFEDLRHLAAKTYTSNPRSSWLDTQIDWANIESAIVLEEKDRSYRPRLPRSDRHMEMATLQTERLINQLVMRCRSRDDGKQDLQGPTAGMREDRLLDEIQELRNQYPRYTAPGKDLAGDAEARSLLSESFRRIFNGAMNAKEVVARICYNLLVSSTPPNIHNYNTLIAGFNRIHRPDLAEAVVMSYLHNCKWPATEQTIICLLDHARGTDNLPLFREIIQRMRGARSDGLHDRIMGRDMIVGEEMERWAREKAYEQKYRFVQKSLRSSGTFDSVIRGWLHFKKVDAAAMAFSASVRSGYSVSIDTIDQLLSSILANVDRTTARTLVRGVVKHFNKFRNLIESLNVQCASTLARRLADMFGAVFDIADLPPVVNFNTIRLKRSDVLKAFNSLRRIMISKSQRSLDKLTDPSDKNAFSGALEKQQRHHGEYQRIASVARIAKRYSALEGSTRRLSALVKASILKFDLGCNLDPQSQLPPVVWNERVPHQPYPAVSQALQWIRMGPRPRSTDEVKAQLLAGIPDQVFARKLQRHPDWRKLSFKALISFYEEQPRSVKPNEADIVISEQQLSDEKVGGPVDDDTEDSVRALVFARLAGEDQKILEDAAPRGYKLPLPKLATPDQLMRWESGYVRKDFHPLGLFPGNCHMLEVATAPGYALQAYQFSC